METSRKRIRRDYAPLDIAVSMRCMTPGSLPTQVYNHANREYEPNRTLTPLVLAPMIQAKAKDGSWHKPHANTELAEMQWLVDGKDITTIEGWKGLYAINNDTNSSERGAITIKKNLLPGSRCAIRFKGVIADQRTGMRIRIESDDVVLSTVEKSNDAYSLAVGECQTMRYDHTRDKLYLYEHKVAQGLINEDLAARQAATDKEAYLREIPLLVTKGSKKATSGYAIKLFMVSDTGREVAMTPSTHPEVLTVALNKIVLDLRLVTKADYIVAVYAEGIRVAQAQFSVNRIVRKFRCQPTNGTGISPDDTVRYDSAMVDCEGMVVECPESVFRILWKTDTEALKGVCHNEGTDAVIPLDKTGIGTTYIDGWLDVYTEAEHKEAECAAVDENGNFYTDESGNVLIFN